MSESFAAALVGRFAIDGNDSDDTIFEIKSVHEVSDGGASPEIFAILVGEDGAILIATLGELRDQDYWRIYMSQEAAQAALAKVRE